ncbi:MAG: MgtC/SapB family protein [Acidobacteriia bacterium]|nr:MgtC/SapB family protein [Terriglobia bacterium]MBV8906488.1 MgtC/SapB family protein [Terriglobia bacterium]MBV9743756.1 MgtC/SapB family protein [Terriglobia bacterium]
MPPLTFLARLFTALALGATVGLERQWRQRMAGARTNALVAAGASAFVMCASLVSQPNASETQIVSYVVSGVGFLGAGVIFKDGGAVRGLNTAATLWCSAAMGAICGLGQLLYALFVAVAVLATNIVLRPIAYRISPSHHTGSEQEVTYRCELVCRSEDEAHIRALLVQAMAQSPLTLLGLKSEDIESTTKLKVIAELRGLGRQDQPLEQLIVRLSLEAGVSSVSWSVSTAPLE